MQVLKEFSENQKSFLLYQSRLEANLLENTYIEGLKEALKEKEQALKEKERALIKLKDLQLLLKKKGIDLEEES